MVEEIKEKFSGEWTHDKDDDLTPFFNVVGASDVEKEYMLNSKPKLSFKVERDVIMTTNTPHPDTQPDTVALCDFKLDEEFQYEPRGLNLQITVNWRNGKMIQNITPLDSHIKPHKIEITLNDQGQLVQTYRVNDELTGKDVTGTRTFVKKQT